jgi:hypothetical protein
MSVKPSTNRLLLVMLSLAACYAPQRHFAIPLEEVGRYSFLVETPEGTRVNGTLDIALDTIVARSEAAPCRVVSEQSRQRLAYECAAPGTAGIRLMIDRRHPVTNSSWAYFTPVRKRRDVCTSWRTWEDGTRTCERSMPEEYIEQVWRTGDLVVTR